jgi:hypothetical protein
MHQLLNQSKAKGTNVHQGTQLPPVDRPEAANTSTSGLSSMSSSTTLFNILSGSASSSKHNSSLFDVPSNSSVSSSKRKLPTHDISGQSSSSIKRSKQSNTQSGNVVVGQLTDVVKDFRSDMKMYNEKVDAPKKGTVERAVKKLEETMEEDQWLLVRNAVTLIGIFQDKPSTAQAFLGLGKLDVRRGWAQMMLKKDDLL